MQNTDDTCRILLGCGNDERKRDDTTWKSNTKNNKRDEKGEETVGGEEGEKGSRSCHEQHTHRHKDATEEDCEGRLRLKINASKVKNMLEFNVYVLMLHVCFTHLSTMRPNIGEKMT